MDIMDLSKYNTNKYDINFPTNRAWYNLIMGCLNTNMRWGKDKRLIYHKSNVNITWRYMVNLETTDTLVIKKLRKVFNNDKCIHTDHIKFRENKLYIPTIEDINKWVGKEII